MPAPALTRLATDACIANIRRINDVGEAPYEIVRPVLLKVENPDQLREIEQNSPQICGADAELWRNLIKRYVPNSQEKIYEPKDPKNWWKVYRKLFREAEAESKEHSAALKARLNQQAEEKGSNQMTFLNKVIDPSKKKKRPATSPARSGDSMALAFRAGSRTKMLTGKDVILRAKREAKEASMFQGTSRILARPTHTLHKGSSKIDKVAKSLLPAHMPMPSNNSTTAASSSNTPGRVENSSSGIRLKPASATLNASPSTPSSTQQSGAQAPMSAIYNPTAAAKRRAAPANIFMPAKKQRRIIH